MLCPGSYREVSVETSGFSPFELMFGKSPRGPLSLINDAWIDIPNCKISNKPHVINCILKLRERLEGVMEIAIETERIHKRKSKVWFDKRSHARSFKPGEKVLLLSTTHSAPLDFRYSGPYVVKQKVGNADYIICTPERRKSTRLVHVNLLKTFFSVDNQFCSPVDSILKLKSNLALLRQQTVNLM